MRIDDTVSFDTTMEAKELAPHYWGKEPLPDGYKMIGLVNRTDGRAGALLLSPKTGIFVQGNDGRATAIPYRV